MFRTKPVNLGVEKELYTFIDAEGSSNSDFELFLAKEVDGPFSSAFDDIFDFRKVYRNHFNPEPKKKQTAKQLGFIVSDEVVSLPISPEHKELLSVYVAALLVRSPKYLKKVLSFHSVENQLPDNLAKQATLENLKFLLDVYAKRICASDLVFIRNKGSNEFLYGDAGIEAKEPWSNYGIPFDIYVPMTPKISLSVLPTPNPRDPLAAIVSDVNNQGVKRFNRIVVGNSKKFVFSRDNPPINFITKYIGKPAAKAHGTRVLKGSVEVIYDSSRDHP